MNADNTHNPDAESPQADANDSRLVEVINLPPEDSIRFAEMILDPPEPNEHLRQAARRYYELVGVDSASQD